MSVLTRAHFDNVIDVLRSQGLTQPTFSMRLVGFEYRDLGPEPAAAFDRCVAEGALDLFLKMRVEWSGAPVQLYIHFDFEDSGFRLGMESSNLYRGNAVWDQRLLCFFNLSRDLAGVLDPLYGVVGPEGWFPFELQPGAVEERGLKPFDMSVLGEDALEEVRLYYDEG